MAKYGQMGGGRKGVRGGRGRRKEKRKEKGAGGWGGEGGGGRWSRHCRCRAELVVVSKMMRCSDREKWLSAALHHFIVSSVFAHETNTDSLTKNRHDACATAMAKILVDSGHANVLEDPHTRNAFMRAVPANRLHAARHFQSATHGGSDAHHPAQAFTNVPTSPQQPRTTPQKSARVTMLFEQKTISFSSSYPNSPEQLRAMITRKKLPTDGKAPAIISYSTPP